MSSRLFSTVETSDRSARFTTLRSRVAALQAQIAAAEGGVYQDPETGRWFVVLRKPGRRRTTTRRRAPDGSRLLTRGQTLIAEGQWEAQLAAGSVLIGRERFETVLRRPLPEPRHLPWPSPL